MKIKSHYGEEYFSWQSNNNKFGAKANQFMFEKLIKHNQKVLDFGCSGGSYLNQYENM